MCLLVNGYSKTVASLSDLWFPAIAICNSILIVSQRTNSVLFILGACFKIGEHGTCVIHVLVKNMFVY